jgi:hypothetical protein
MTTKTSPIMKNSVCQIGDLDRKTNIKVSCNYIVACREAGCVLSEHKSERAAFASKARKQPYWVQKIYDDTRLMRLYVYRRTGADSFEMIEDRV